jgi:hypothetical protein
LSTPVGSGRAISRRPLVAAIAGGLGLVILVVAVFIAISIVERQNAVADHGVAVRELADAVEASEAVVAEADELLSVATDPLLPVEQVAAVTSERDAAAAALVDAEQVLDVDPEPLDTRGIRELSVELRLTSRDLQDDDDLVLAALADLVSVTHAASPAIEAANFDAENAPHLAFRDAVADLGDATGDMIAEYLLGYLDAAHALESSHAEEIAEKAGPLLERRLAVQAFARSISGGVLLDFDWAVTVNGYGTQGSYGGTSYWYAAEGGYATITLSDSVATMWPGAGVQSLVAHEVGHAILAKCTDLFFESDFYTGEEESWATAWAIGMGYSADGNGGETIYGRPADGLIQLSLECR